MIPSATLVPTSSSSAVVTRVDKATSEFLFGPDWTVNIGICDSINSNRWPAKDVVKAVKKRLQHKNPKVQILALTLLETMVKNCGDSVHFQIVERNILQEMIKIVKKKMDMSVREKILVLLSSWQEAFGGPGGRNPQYYWAYEELRRSGVQFPRHSSDAAALSAPPTAHQTLRHSQAGYGMPSNTSTRLDEAMASGIENLSLSTMNSMWNVLGLLSDMLQAVNPNDCEVVKDEVIVDLVEQCRANRKKLMQLLTTMEDEELLGQGIELNDGLQIALAKHDAIASGSPLPTQVTNLTVAQDSSSKAIEARDDRHEPAAIPSLSLVPVSNHQIEEEEEDDFAQLARRHSKMPSTNTKSTSSGTSDGVISASTSSTSATLAPPSNALVLVPGTPAPVKSTNSQDMIDFLGITLSTAATSPLNPTDPTSSTQSMNQVPFSPTLQAYPYYSQTYPGNQAQVPSNSYVVPWAQLQPQPQQPQPQFSSGCPPPPWAVATPGYYRNQNTPTYSPFQGARQLQQLNTFPARGINESATNGDAPMSSAPAGHKPFVPSYRLFEDLNVLGSANGRFRTSNTPPSLSGTSSQSMVGSRK